MSTGKRNGIGWFLKLKSGSKYGDIDGSQEWVGWYWSRWFWKHFPSIGCPYPGFLKESWKKFEDCDSLICGGEIERNRLCHGHDRIKFLSWKLWGDGG